MSSLSLKSFIAEEEKSKSAPLKTKGCGTHVGSAVSLGEAVK